MKIKDQLIRTNVFLLESQILRLKNAKKKFKYSMGDLIRKGVEKILEECEK